MDYDSNNMDIKRLIEIITGDQQATEDAEAERTEQKYRRNSERWIRGMVHRMSYLRAELAKHPELENVAEETVREYMEQYTRCGFR